MSLQELMRQRREKLAHWRALGVEPYAYRFEPTHRAAELIPTSGILIEHTFEPELARAEIMWRDIGQRPATQRRTPRCLHPFELAVRLWESVAGHVH